MNYLYLLVGLIGLFFGNEALVRGCVGIVRRMAILPLPIGTTTEDERCWAFDMFDPGLRSTSG